MKKKKKKRIRRVIGGVRNFLVKDQRIINRSQIEEILPHRGRMLFLDEVVITNKNILGKFTVTDEVCKGHEFNSQLVFRGVDIIEMAAQVLGIWLAQHSESKDQIAFFRRILGEVKFYGMVVPSNVLLVEIPVIAIDEDDEDEKERSGNPRIEISGRPDRLLKRAVAENITARVGSTNKAVILGIEFSIINQQSLAR